MNKNLVGFLIAFFVVSTALSQNKDTTWLNLTNFKLYPGTFSWRGGSTTYYDMTSGWDSSPFTEGHLRQGNQFRLNYRLLYPGGYDPSYSEGYPMIVMLHGGGERGNCWNTDCYCATCLPNDPQVEWIYVTLGGSAVNVSRIKITWKDATSNGSNFLVQTSTDATNWTTVQNITNNTALINDFTGLALSARYVRIYGTKPVGTNGFAINELEVYNGANNVAQNKTVTVSTTNDASNQGGNRAVDGNLSTQWISTLKYLNNDNVLSQGGQTHLKARNDALNKKPNDPTLSGRAFPGFIFYPQNANAWGNDNSTNSDLSYALRTIRLLCRQLNIDQNRIYIHGLSLGGQATYKALNMADWLFAAAAPMSALTFTNGLEYDSVANIPLWAFQGGKDGEPTPAQTEALVKKFREAGGNARYTLYPTLGHGTWNTAYAEPDFFIWLLSKNKADIHVPFGNPNICGTNGAGVKLTLAQGFYAYQWERDGQIIPGANSYIHLATQPGVYRARFSRKSKNPTEQEWNRWSAPVTIGEQSPPKPEVKQVGTIVLRDLNNNKNAVLKGPAGYTHYQWYKNDVLTTINDSTSTPNIGGCSPGPCPNSGAYTLVTSGFDLCPSPPSEPKYVVMGVDNTTPAIANKPTTFTGRVTSPSSALLSWGDASKDERNYEIWRKKTTDTNWIMAGMVDEDITQFHDTGLAPNSTYWYKVRGVNNLGRSDYSPGNSKTVVAQNLVISTSSDAQNPTTPQNVTATATAIKTIKLDWEASTDDSGIKGYYIYYGSDSVLSNSTATTYTLTNLVLNTVYNFTVKAVDVNGNLSLESNQASANTYVDGLYWEHSTGAWTTFSQITNTIWDNPEFTGKIANFSLEPRTQEDYFNFRFYGYIYIQTAGTYRFRVGSNDGARLTIDGTQRVNRDGIFTDGTCSTTESSNFTLSAGPHTIELRYFEYTASQCLDVQYRGPDTGAGANPPYTVIPNNRLRSYNTLTPPSAPAAPTNLVATPTSMTQINLSWQYGGQNPNQLKIAVVGSSSVVGTGATPITNGWVYQLANWISSTTTGATVSNLGVGGSDTYDAMPTGSPAPATPDANTNITKALSLNPNFILVNLPTNDVANSIPLTTTMNNFRTIKNAADAQGVPIFFTTSQPRNNVTTEQRALLETTADSIRAEFGQYVIDIYDELTDFTNDRRIKAIYHAGDQIHVNNAGHTYIFQTAQAKLAPYLQSFELYRATASAGPFTLVTKTNQLSFADNNLTPGTTYYYKVRTVDVNGVSAFSAVVSTTTLTDSEPPTQPTGLSLTATTFTNASLVWNVSTDNIKVVGYEIWGNGVLLGTSPIPGYQATNLTPNTNYTFYVVAYDASNNKSIPSATVNGFTSGATYFYSKSSGNLNTLGTWGQGTDGNGAAPSSFSNNGQYLVVSNRTTSSLGGSWAVDGNISKVIVPSGVTLTVDNSFTARVEVQGTGTVNLNFNSIPNFISLSDQSTVNYTAATPFIQPNTYGNLGLSGAGAKTFPNGTIPVRGNIIAATGVSLKGASGNTTKITLGGNLTFSGAPSTLAPDFGIILELNGTGPQVITAAGTLDLYQLKTVGASTVNLANTGTPFNLSVGALAGGGLSLANGSTLNLDANNLVLVRYATINTAGETGRIAINGGDINITSASTSNSNLYFNATNNTVKYFGIDLTGSGDVVIQENMKISDALKVKNGEFNAGGHVTLLSTDTKTANIQEIENSGTITGNVTVQRYLNPKGRVYRYISSPVAGVTIADWQTAFPITGNFIGASTGAGLSAAASLFYYDEPTGWINYPTLPSDNNTKPIEKGRGYAAFIRNATTSTTIQVTGNPYQGNVPLTLDGGNTTLTGWNLLGNPYASTIAWNNQSTAWIKTPNVISSSVAVRDNPLGQFKYYDYATGLGALTGGKIAPGQAFWVQVVVNNPTTLTITEKAKSTEQQIIYREAAPASHLQVNLKQGDVSDPAYIAFTDFGTDQYDGEFDANKMDNVAIFNLSTLINDTIAVAINNVSDAFCSKTVKLNVQNVTAGSYSLSFEGLESLSGVGAIALTDNFTNTTVDLNETNVYSFSVTSDSHSFGKGRFSISFGRPALQLSAGVASSAICGESAQVTLTNTQKGVAYVAMNQSDEVISEAGIGNGGVLVLTIPSAHVSAGTNQVHIKAGFKGCPETSATLPVTTSFAYNEKPVVEVAESVITLCPGSSTTLTASGAPANGSYRWYNEAEQPISGANQATLETPEIQQKTSYFVAAINASGCESDRKMVNIFTESVVMPVISMDQDTLYGYAYGYYMQWLRNGEPIQGANSLTYKPEASGSYTLSVATESCAVVSLPVDVVITGTEELDGDFAVSAFPNPTHSGNINVRVKTLKQLPIEISMIDLVGKPIITHTFEASDLEAGVQLQPKEELAGGLYFIIATQGQTVAKRKIIIKN